MLGGAPLFINNCKSDPGFPASLPLTIWVRANYSYPSWTSQVSNGSSSITTLKLESDITPTYAPTEGATQSGYVPAQFSTDLNNGKYFAVYDNTSVATYPDNLLLNNAIFSSSAGSFFCLFNADEARSPSPQVYANGNFLHDTSHALTAFGFDTDGIGCSLFDSSVGTYDKVINIACGIGAYHLAQFKWDGTNLKGRLDSNSWVSIACGPVNFNYVPAIPPGPSGAVGASNMVVGLAYGTTNANDVTGYFKGRILELGTSNTTISDTDFDNIKNYCNSRYRLSL